MSFQKPACFPILAHNPILHNSNTTKKEREIIFASHLSSDLTVHLLSPSPSSLAKFCELSQTSSNFVNHPQNYCILLSIILILVSAFGQLLYFISISSLVTLNFFELLHKPSDYFDPLCTTSYSFAHLHISSPTFWLTSVIFSTTSQLSSDLCYTTHCHFCGLGLGFWVEHHQWN